MIREFPLKFLIRECFLQSCFGLWNELRPA